ncbi:Cytochrome P450 protein [Quillaja saponaria]|uniref:Cytochrome P450 protein n=1 Tax=Quillaja saponaria TaxID=32244 RepID=A0AAD7P5Y2_QUISA|nr:Cytochrome P450 protein [Quillaja saponaria]
MGIMGNLLILLLCSLCLYLFVALVKVLHKPWWTPIRMQYLMTSQGIKGPPYRFIHGNTKEIFNKIKETSDRPMNLSNDIFSTVEPHIYEWKNKYGKNFLQWHGPQAVLVVTEPELIIEILNNKDRAYPKGKVNRCVKKLLGDGLVKSKGEKWAKMRKLANYAFHGESLKLLPAMVDSAKTILGRGSKKGSDPVIQKEDPNPEDIARLKTMTMIINESIRLHPPVIGFDREVARKIKLGKLILPANLHLRIRNLALNHDPQLWGEDVNYFRPERFSQRIAKATNNNTAAFFPFGNGPRTCVGLNFALNETKIVLSMILQRYSFTLSPSYTHSPVRVLTIRPEHGIQIMLHSLNSEEK